MSFRPGNGPKVREPLVRVTRPPAVLARLHDCQTAFALVSRAPLAKIEAYRKSHGWTLPWYSSYGSDFNYDFQVTLDESVGQLIYNYRPEPGLLGGDRSTEMPGASCFLRTGTGS